MDLSPRALIKTVQRDLSKGDSISKLQNIKKDDSKNVIKGFINIENVSQRDYSELLENTIFSGCYPHVVDQVFYLERYASDNRKPPTSSSSDGQFIKIGSTKNEKTPVKAALPALPTTMPNNKTVFVYEPQSTFEKLLIALNVLLFMGIVLFGCSVLVVIIAANN